MRDPMPIINKIIKIIHKKFRFLIHKSMNINKDAEVNIEKPKSEWEIISTGVYL